MIKKAFGYFFYVLAVLMFNATFANAGVPSVASVCDEVCVELSANDDFGFGQTSCTLPQFGGSQMMFQHIVNINEKQLKNNFFGTIPPEAIIKNNNPHYHSYAKNILINLSIQELLFPFHSFW